MTDMDFNLFKSEAFAVVTATHNRSQMAMKTLLSFSAKALTSYLNAQKWTALHLSQSLNNILMT